MAQFVQRGQELIDRGQHQEAVRVCRLGLLASPTEVDGRLVLGSALMALGRYDEVLAEMRVAIEMAPDSVRAHALKAGALLQKGDALQAREIIDRALDLDPGDPESRALFGQVQAVVGGSGRGVRASSASFLDPLESRTKELPHTHELHPAARQTGAASEDKSSTIEIDEDLEGVEVVADEPVADITTESAPVGLGDEEMELLDGVNLDRLNAPAPGFFPGDPDDELDTDAPTGDYGGIGERTEFSDLPTVRAGAAPLPASDPQIPADDSQSGVTVSERPSRLPSPDPAELPGPPTVRPATGEGFGNIPAQRARSESGWAPFPRSGSDNDGGPPSSSSELEGDEPPRVQNEDMRLIREGLGMEDTTHGGFASAGGGRRRARDARPGRRGTARAPQLVRRYSFVALIVLAGAVFGGLEVRERRLEGEISSAVRQAQAAAALDTYRGYLGAAGIYERVAEVRGERGARAAVARAEAAIAAEFWEHIERAQAAVAAIASDPPSRDGRAARALLAIAAGDPVAARARARDFIESHPDDALGHYLEGRAALMAGDLVNAVAILSVAPGKGVSPRVYVRLGQAQAGLGNYADAIAAFESAQQIVDGHPAAVLGEAHARVRSGALGEQRDDYEQRVRQLEAEAERPVSEQKLGVAPVQAAWASLVLAELAVARGARDEALEFLDAALQRRRAEDFRFADAAIGLFIELGLVKRAQAEAERALAMWPERGRVRVAEIAVLRGNAQQALDVLDGFASIGERPSALAVRGRARLVLDDVEGAARDLDAALEASPEHRGAALARAELDLRRGDASAAVRRLSGIYGADPRPDVAAVYARALRMSGKLAQAREVLDELAKADSSAQTLLEVARLKRASGDFDEARQAYETAIEADPEAVGARLESAVMAFDVGDAAGATAAIDALVAETKDDATVLAEAARVRSLTGDFAGAAELVERLENVPAAPRWLVRRERGRLELARKRPRKAVQDLELAASLQPDDGETRFLLLSAYLDAEDGESAGKVLRDILKRFVGRPIADMAHGRMHFYKDRPKDALLSFATARDALIDKKAAPRQVGEAMYWIGRVHYYNGDLDAARDSLRDAISRNPASGDAYYVLGQVEFEAKNLRAAASAYGKATEVHPKRAEVWFALGETLAKLRRRKRARQAIDKYLELAPDGDLAKTARRLRRRL